jgi:hypothetical protein
LIAVGGVLLIGVIVVVIVICRRKRSAAVEPIEEDQHQEERPEGLTLPDPLLSANSRSQTNCWSGGRGDLDGGALDRISESGDTGRSGDSRHFGL